MTESDVDRWFRHHAPDLKQVGRIREIRAGAHDLARLILRYTPKSGDQSSAIRKLREVVMTANAAIVCEDKDKKGPG